MPEVKEWTFDRDWTRGFTRVRQEFVAGVLKGLGDQVQLRSALDLGCGVGDFSRFLADMGFRVSAVDGREENLTEAKRRHPDISFVRADAESLPLDALGKFDLVLCFGLLYHLENPFRAIRQIYSLTGQLLLIETMCAPYETATMDLLDEGASEDQGLNYIAFYPSESCLVKMLHRAGFSFVYQFRSLPDDPLFKRTLFTKQRRTLLAASKIALSLPNLAIAEDGRRWAFADPGPWSTKLGRMYHQLIRLPAWTARALKPMVRLGSAKTK